MIEYGYWDATQNQIVWVKSRSMAERMAKARDAQMFGRDVSRPYVVSIRA